MGNRTYLETEHHLLFETNNSLATFLLFGLNAQTLSILKDQCRQLDILALLGEEEEELVEKQIIKLGLEEISLSLDTYLSQLKKRELLLFELYPELQELFGDFCQIIDQERSCGAKRIILGITAYGAFYNSYQDFFDEIMALYQQLETHSKIKLIFKQNIIASTTGFDTYTEHEGERIAIKERKVFKKEKFDSEEKRQNWWTKVKNKFMD